QLCGKHRWIVRPALSTRKTQERLRQRIDTGTLGVGSGPAITRQMRLDKSWNYGGGYSHALGCVGAQVGDQRVGGSGNPLHDPLAGIRLRIYTNRALVEIHAVKVRPGERSGDVAGR